MDVTSQVVSETLTKALSQAQLVDVIIMSLQQENQELSAYVRGLQSFSEYSIGSTKQGWNSSYLEFKLFTAANSTNRDSSDSQKSYFKLINIPSQMKYVKEKYMAIYKDFEGLFLNVEVQQVTKKIHDCVYLIRSANNYFSLFNLIETKDRKVVSIPFILKLLQFFDHIIKVNDKANLKIDLRATNILENDEGFRLADYQLLFHPANLKSKEKRLRENLVNQMQYVIFDVLSLTNRQNRNKFSTSSQTLVAQMKERSTEETLKFTNIIEAFFETGEIRTEEIFLLKNGLGQSTKQENSSLSGSGLTSSDISVPLLGSREGEGLSESEVTFMKQGSSFKNKNSKKLFWLLAIIAVLMIGVIVGVTFYLLNRGPDCGKYHYQEDKQCFSCPSVCYSCVGAGEQNCTLCMPNYWLIVNSSEGTKGRCSTECRGLKDSSRMHCISLTDVILERTQDVV